MANIEAPKWVNLDIINAGRPFIIEDTGNGYIIRHRAMNREVPGLRIKEVEKAMGVSNFLAERYEIQSTCRKDVKKTHEDVQSCLLDNYVIKDGLGKTQYANFRRDGKDIPLFGSPVIDSNSVSAVIPKKILARKAPETNFDLVIAYLNDVLMNTPLPENNLIASK